MNTASHHPITRQRISILFEAREEIILQLSGKRSISLVDASGLDRSGRCRLADEHWAACTEELRDSLLNHHHHFVRSCAVVAQQKLAQAHDGVIKEQSQDELKLRLRDLDRQAAEMESNEVVQSRLSVPNSAENQNLVALNITLFHVRHRLKHHFGFEQPGHTGNWLI
jgi:hypothetical protein